MFSKKYILYILYMYIYIYGLPKWLSSKKSACQCRRCKRHEFSSWVKKIRWRRKWQPTPAFLTGNSHWQGNLAGYSSWGHKESDMRARTHTHTHTHTYMYMKAFLKNTNARVLLFFLQSSRCLSNEHSCLKTTGLYGDLVLLCSVFHFFYFIFSALISFSLCFLISLSVSFFSFDVLSHAFPKCSRKAFIIFYGTSVPIFLLLPN